MSLPFKTKDSPLKLKEIPLENGNGEPLKVCPSCRGAGLNFSANCDDVELKGSKKFAPRTIKRGEMLDDSLIRMFKKNGWGVRSYDCVTCKGAGMMRAEVSRG
jgi:hypothetical protein